MPITTAGDLIAFCLRTASVNGIGQTPSAEDSNDGLIILQDIMAQWQTMRWMNWSLGDTAKVSTGASSYTIGPGMDFPVPRPDRIASAYARFLPVTGNNPVDYPLGIIESREDWNAVTLKTLSTIPVGVFYESAWPNALLHFWPVPPADHYELHISTKAPLPAFANLTDPVDMPPVYRRALRFTLAVELAMNYGQTPAPANVAGMQVAMGTIRASNIQIPTQQMPTVGGQRSSSIAAGGSAWFQSGGMI